MTLSTVLRLDKCIISVVSDEGKTASFSDIDVSQRVTQTRIIGSTSFDLTNVGGEATATCVGSTGGKSFTKEYSAGS